MSEPTQQMDYFVGGHLDGMSLPINWLARPVMVEAESGHVYTRHPALDNDLQRIWIQESEPSKIVAALPELTQRPKPGTKELDLDDLAAFVLTAQRLGFSKTTKVRGLLTWLGFAREIRVHRQDDPTTPEQHERSE
ncbi:hypothetical protein SEA_ABBA_62 [Arthrobacter phage Abba]|uniref:Uncharacterized protein n=1 Tax=Arthrobacter phage Abba TaxID=2713256 RepID=A0A6G8R2J8_9CAUD|nr:hypothetical protein HYQ28_gp62 [Arthrobacter phage Abba]QIN94391.1 hypothetical protein SEA_ABBA_62 [Arthrobacter phage Abba]